MRLADVPNYAWRTQVSDDARTYFVQGKTTKDGCTWMRLPLTEAISRRLGPAADVELEAVFRGTQRCVVRTDDGWRAVHELPERHEDWPDEIAMRHVYAAPRAMRGVGVPRGARHAGTFALSEQDARSYSNAQFALVHPHDELAVIVSSHTGLSIEGDAVSGALTDVGARLLLVREGQPHLQALAGAGTFRLHLKDGMVVRYSVRLEGILAVNGKRLHVHQQGLTDITGVGATSVSIPPEARSKLGLVE